MKKRTAFIGAMLSLIPFGQPLLIKTVVVLSSTGLMLALPEKVTAENAFFFFKSGNEKADKGDYYGAIFDYTKAIEIDPKDADAYVNRGYSLRMLKDYDSAIVDFNKALTIDQNNVTAYNNLAWTKRMINDNYGAIFDATKAIEIDPNYSNPYLNRGVAKENLGDINGACDDWRKASSLGNERTAEWVRDQC